MTFFDPDTVPDMDFSPLPPGRYVAFVDELKIKATKKGDGRLVSLVLLVGKERRKVFTNFNIENPNKVAERIGKAELKQFLYSVGHRGALAKENDLFLAAANKTCQVELAVGPDHKGQDQNKVKRFLPAATAAAVSQPVSWPEESAKQPLDDELSKIPF